jgi:hypothetical protein
VSATAVLDPEQRAQRVAVARERRRSVLRVTAPVLRAAGWLLLLASACSSLYVDGVALPGALLAAAVGSALAARRAGRAVPPPLTLDARAQLTVREAWRELRADADLPRPHPRHAVWVDAAGDGTVRLWRLTRSPGLEPAADGGYAIHATVLAELEPDDTVAAAEALAVAQDAAERDERAALEGLSLARALR